MNHPGRHRCINSVARRLLHLRLYSERDFCVLNFCAPPAKSTICRRTTTIYAVGGLLRRAVWLTATTMQSARSEILSVNSASAAEDGLAALNWHSARIPSTANGIQTTQKVHRTEAHGRSEVVRKQQLGGESDLSCDPSINRQADCSLRVLLKMRIGAADGRFSRESRFGWMC